VKQKGIGTPVIVLIIALGIAVVGGLSYSVLSQDASVVETTTETSSTSTQSSTSSTTTTPTTSSTETQYMPTDSVDGALGSPVTDGVTQITVNSMRYTDAVEDEVAGPGNKFLILNISVQNVGQEEKVSYNLLHFRVLDSQGNPYQQDDASSYHLETLLWYGDLLSGEVDSGEASYKVPVDETSFWLEYQGYYYVGEGIKRSALFSIELG